MVIAAIVIFLVMQSIPNQDGSYILLSLINAVITSIAIFSFRKYSFSIHKMVNFFILFFFVIANSLQFSKHVNVTHVPLIFTDNDYVNFQIVVLFIIVFYNIFYYIYLGKTREKKRLIFQEVNKFKTNPHINNRILLIISFISLSITLFHFKDDIAHLFVRGLIEDSIGASFEKPEGTIGSQISGKIIRSSTFVCYMIARYFNINKNTRIILFLFMLISLFPTSLPRNAAAVYWIPVILSNVKFLHKENVFMLLAFFGLLVLFPLFGRFRNFTGEFDWRLSFDFLSDINFDTSQEFMIVIRKDIVTWGQQLLGSILFFVPRSIWPSKPIGSGALITENYDDDTNVSMPFFGEGYINFGYLGVFFFSFALAAFSAHFDYLYWKVKKYKRDSSLFGIYYFIIVSSMLYILRGDMMSSFAYTFATLINVHLIWLLIKKFSH